MALLPDILHVANNQEMMKTGNIFVYIDNSNIWIQGQKTYADKYNRDTIDEDLEWRFNVGNLKETLLAKSGLSAHEAAFKPNIKWYGSMPLVFIKLLESHDMTVKTFAKSSWTGREKEVDTELVADAVEDAADACYTKTPAVFIIVSGDRDLRPAVVKIANKGFPVHIWSWKNGIAESFTREDKDVDPCLLHVHYLDPFLDNVGFCTSSPIESVVVDSPVMSSQFCELNKCIDDEEMGAMEYNHDNKIKQGEDNRNDNHGKKRDTTSINSWMADSDNEGFEEANKRPRNQHNRPRKYSASLQFRCDWRMFCGRKLDCTYGHTEEEKQTFLVYGNDKAKKYKLCIQEACVYGARCHFAHGLRELFCPTCGETGVHMMESCPERSSAWRA